MDTVKARRARLGIDPETDLQLLQRCETLWNNLEPFREQRHRALRFVYGDQWADYIMVNGKVMTQKEYIIKQGNVALQSNQIATKVNTIAGLLVKQANEPVCLARDRKEQQYGEVITEALQANCNKNKMELMYTDAMEEYTIGGFAGLRESYEYRNGRVDSWTYKVGPNHVFWDSAMKDPRMWDMSLIGEIHDLYFTELCEKFAKSEQDYSLLRDIYSNEAFEFGGNDVDDLTKKNDLSRLDFRTPADRNLCRVYEVWTKEAKPRLWCHDTSKGTLWKIDAEDSKARAWVKETNERRKALAVQAGWDETPLIETTFFFDTTWYCRFLAPDGSVLWEGESNYPGGGHPFSLCIAPFKDGMIIGYVADSIDHNIAINRALTLQDWLVRTQAKGVTMIPKALVPDDMDYTDFAEQWTSIDGLIFYDPKPGIPQPSVFHGAAVNFDASRLIQMYKGLMDDSVAVSGALQGQTPHSGTSAALYAQQTANSSTPIASMMSKFHSFMEDVATKKMKNIAAFYDIERLESIAGRIDGLFDAENLNLNEISDMEFDLEVHESTETPVYRMISNDYLMQMFQMGAISIEDLLQYGTFPFADRLLQGIEARKSEAEAVQQGLAPGSSPM